MQTALPLSDKEYAAALSIFFALYCLLEVPSNLILKKMGAKKWIPIIVVAWGIVMLLTGFSNNFAALFAWRLLLGAAEAGLFPGITVSTGTRSYDVALKPSSADIICTLFAHSGFALYCTVLPDRSVPA